MSLPLAAIWRISRRDLSAHIRGLRLLAICLFLGVATLAAIGSLTAGIADELSRRGQTILGGDVEIGIAQREATQAEMSAMRKAGQVSQTVRLRAMAIAGEADGDSLLAELKAVDSIYPHYGALTLRGGGRVKAPAKGEIYIGPTLSERLDIKIGGAVRFGEERFKVLGIIDQEPDRLGEGFTLGPVAIINMASLPDTALIQPGSMYEAKYRIKLSANEDAAAVAKTLEAQFPSAGWDITDRSNGAPGTRRFIERMGQFLTLVGLAALVIAGIGVGNGVSSYLASKRASIATLKVTGADSGTIFRIYMLQILAVAAGAVIAGLAVGSVMPSVIGWVAGDILPVAPGFNLRPLPLLVSAIYGLLIAIAFALPPLARAHSSRRWPVPCHCRRQCPHRPAQRILGRVRNHRDHRARGSDCAGAFILAGIYRGGLWLVAVAYRNCVAAACHRLACPTAKGTAAASGACKPASPRRADPGIGCGAWAWPHLICDARCHPNKH